MNNFSAISTSKDTGISLLLVLSIMSIPIYIYDLFVAIFGFVMFNELPSHNYFLYSYFGLKQLVPGLTLQLLHFLLLSILTALMVKVISELIQKLFTRFVV